MVCGDGFQSGLLGEREAREGQSMVCFQASCHHGLDPAGDVENSIGCGPWPVPTCVTRELGNVFIVTLVSQQLKAEGVAIVVLMAGQILAARESIRQGCSCQLWKARSMCPAMVPPTRMWAGHQQHP